jgi:DmsE family decaheme c-type cytochrome
MRKLLYYLLTTTAVVLLVGVLESAPTINGVPKAQASPASIMRQASQPPATAVKAATSAQACAGCHEDEVAAWSRTTHAKSWQDGKSCEQCHGDVTKHLETGGAKGTITSMATLSPDKVSETCVNCHERTGEQSHVRLSEHARAGVACTSCHEVHPTAEHKDHMNAQGKLTMLRKTETELCVTCHKTTSADFNKPTHHRLIEGVLTCSNCHNPHGSNQPHQLRADTKTLCVSCHQDKRGPFAHEHFASAIDGCTTCHEQHGSSARNMLKFRDPRTLCLSCHSKEIGGAAVPHSRANNSLQTTGDCTRCHSAIHGSNRSEFLIGD